MSRLQWFRGSCSLFRALTLIHHLLLVIPLFALLSCFAIMHSTASVSVSEEAAAQSCPPSSNSMKSSHSISCHWINWRSDIRETIIGVVVVVIVVTTRTAAVRGGFSHGYDIHDRSADFHARNTFLLSLVTNFSFVNISLQINWSSKLIRSCLSIMLDINRSFCNHLWTQSNYHLNKSSLQNNHQSIW